MPRVTCPVLQPCRAFTDPADGLRLSRRAASGRCDITEKCLRGVGFGNRRHRL